MPSEKPPMPEALQEFQKQWDDLNWDDISSSDYYFNSYAHLGIHEEMLKDSTRTGTYQRAIKQNKHLFEGKTVLDVGSGTGILSFFAAQAGAKAVYGVECAEIVDIAKKIAKDNKLDQVVHFIKGKIEEVELPVEKVDIIISEWMGYFLLYESMLDSVIFARDKWLTPGGLIFPDKATLFVAGIEDAEYKTEKIDFWDNVYGLTYRCVRPCVMQEPLVDTVHRDAVITDPCTLLTLDLNKVSVADLDFAAPIALHVKRKDFIHALVAWFDVSFSACHKPVTFTTGPFDRYTHWKQTVFYLDTDLIVGKDERVHGMIAVRKSSKNPRDIDIKLHYSFIGVHQKEGVKETQFFRLR